MFGLPRPAGDVWCCVLELNAWRRCRQDPPPAGYQELCRELTACVPGASPRPVRQAAGHARGFRGLVKWPTGSEGLAVPSLPRQVMPAGALGGLFTRSRGR